MQLVVNSAGVEGDTVGTEVVLLTFGRETDGGVGCHGEADPARRVPVLACRDALRAGGAAVDVVVARTDADVDAQLVRVDAGARLVAAVGGDAELRAVLRRMVRRHAPPPSKRPDDLPDDRTVPDLPPIGVLPLGPTASGPGGGLIRHLDLPQRPADVAAAVLGGTTRRLDLLRNDGGSVTLHGALLGGGDDAGRVVPFHARVNVDDAVLSDGSQPMLACAVANGPGYAQVDGLPLAPGADAGDGVADVAVAFAVYHRTWRGLLPRRQLRIEVRRGRGRAVVVDPRADVAYLDDGVAGVLKRKRTWWMERGAWAVYVS